MSDQLQLDLVCRYGKVRSIYSDELQSIIQDGATTITRASHVEPSIDGRWIADMSPSNGPLLGPFMTRKGALLAEVEWLKKNRNL